MPWIFLYQTSFTYFLFSNTPSSTPKMSHPSPGISSVLRLPWFTPIFRVSFSLRSA